MWSRPHTALPPEATQLPEFLLILSLECCLSTWLKLVFHQHIRIPVHWKGEREGGQGEQFPFTMCWWEYSYTRQQRSLGNVVTSWVNNLPIPDSESGGVLLIHVYAVSATHSEWWSWVLNAGLSALSITPQILGKRANSFPDFCSSLLSYPLGP